MSRARGSSRGDLGYPLFVPGDPLPAGEDQFGHGRVSAPRRIRKLAQGQALQPLQTTVCEQSAAGPLVGIPGQDRVDAVPGRYCVQPVQGKAAVGQLAHVPLGGVDSSNDSGIMSSGAQPRPAFSECGLSQWLVGDLQ